MDANLYDSILMQEFSIYLKLQVEFSPAFQDHNFVSDYRIQKFFDPKRTSNKDVFFVKCF